MNLSSVSKEIIAGNSRVTRHGVSLLICCFFLSLWGCSGGGGSGVSTTAAIATGNIITASAGTGGSIAPAGRTTVNFGESQTYAITPATGYRIAGVTVDGIPVSAVSSYTFSNVTASHTISAIFSAIELVRTMTDVPYATLSPSQQLDLYLPPVGTGPFPFVVWVHGGGWASGDKYLAPGAPQFGLLARGYAVASINYRLSSEAIFPAQIHDVKAALRFLRRHAAEYGIDKTRVTIWGFSSGGHLAALAGTSGKVAALEDLTQGNADESSLVQAVIDWSAPIDFRQLDVQTAANSCPPYNGSGYDSPLSPVSVLLGATISERPDLVQAANPITYKSTDDPPFFIQHGSQDCSVPPQQSQQFNDALLPVVGSGRVTVQFLPGGHGGPAFDDPVNIGRIADFLDLQLK